MDIDPARDGVAVSDRSQRRRLEATLVEREGTARMEGAAARQIQRVRWLTLDRLDELSAIGRSSRGTERSKPIV